MSREVLTYYQSSAIYRAAGKYGGYILMMELRKIMNPYERLLNGVPVEQGEPKEKKPEPKKPEDKKRKK